MFKNPFSKKEDMTIDSAYDKELEQKEKDALGEDQTLLEYSKDFPDPTKKDFPHNTTWDPIYQDGEPSKPGMPVTYSPESNDAFLDQNSPGGYPRRFMGKPKGEWFSNEGEVNEFLIDMLRNKESTIDSMTRDITAITKQYALYIGGRLATRTLTYSKALKIVRERFPEYYNSQNFEIKKEDYTTASLDRAGYFISPEGEVFELEGKEGHFDFVRQMYDIEDLQPERQMQEMFSNGWARVREGDYEVSVEVADIFNIPPHVEEFLNRYPEDTIIYIDGHGVGQSVTLEMDELSSGLQKAVNKALSQKRMGKKAELIEMDFANGTSFPILINPTFNEVLGLWKRSSSKHLRLLSDSENGEKYIWDGYFATHEEIEKNFTGFRDTLLSDDLDNLSVIRSIFKESFLKQAGDQSASVPDYLINEWKTEQINNDTDEEPYINHDQRDYPYGMHDSPENTAFNIGWAKDNQPYVVRLDTLENPAYRLDPFGIGEYNVTWYTSLPFSDGIEQMNP